MIPMSFTVINTQLPPSRRPVGLVLFGITATMAPAIGPYIGGLLTDNYDLRAICSGLPRERGVQMIE
jgi:MFS transporter, DHA2 family, multidrug resistance protein